MLDNLLFSINTVFPVFIIVFLGWVFKQTGFLSGEFFSSSDKLVFNVALPALMFTEVANASIETALNAKLVVFICGAIILSFLILCVSVPLFVKGSCRRGAFIQGAYRSNFSILGVPLAQAIFGNEGLECAAVMMPFVILLFNVFAVIILSIYAPEEQKLSLGKTIRKIAVSIIKNPLIIAVLSGVPFMILGIKLPVIASKSLGYLSGMCVALALLSLGANFRVEELRGRWGYALSSSLIKTIVLPALVVTAAIILGFRGVHLGVIFVLFTSPTAVSSYIMAKSMKSDHCLAGQILIMTTGISVFTIFAGTFILKSAGLI